MSSAADGSAAGSTTGGDGGGSAGAGSVDGGVQCRRVAQVDDVAWVDHRADVVVACPTRVAGGEDRVVEVDQVLGERGDVRWRGIGAEGRLGDRPVRVAGGDEVGGHTVDLRGTVARRRRRWFGDGRAARARHRGAASPRCRSRALRRWPPSTPRRSGARRRPQPGHRAGPRRSTSTSPRRAPCTGAMACHRRRRGSPATGRRAGSTVHHRLPVSAIGPAAVSGRRSCQPAPSRHACVHVSPSGPTGWCG